MKGFSIDDKGVWRTTAAHTILYPDKGNKDAQDLEDSGSFWFEHRSNILRNAMHNFPFHNDFADIGGANGFELSKLKKAFPARQYYLIEPGYYGCLTARKRGIENVYNCLFQEFDFSKTNIDGLGLFDVLEHTPGDKKFLNDLHSAINPGTIIYITLPAYEFLWNDGDDYGGHQRRYNKKMVYETASATPFQILYFTYFFSYVVVPTYILRTIPYKIYGNRSEEERVKAEFQQHMPGKVLRFLFNQINAWEIRKVQACKIVPFGGSCLMVLRK